MARANDVQSDSKSVPLTSARYVRCQATADFVARQWFLEHLIAHVNSSEAHLTHRVFYAAEVLLAVDCARCYSCGFLIMVFLVLINDFHRACDHSFEPAAF